MFPELIRNLNAEQSGNLKLASKIFSTDLYPLSKSFLDDTQNVFNAEAETLNFNDSEISADKINKWVGILCIIHLKIYIIYSIC